MINGLKRKFVIMATLFMILLMAILISVMNVVNYMGVVSESDSILDVMVRPDTPFFDENRPEGDKEPPLRGDGEAPEKPPADPGNRQDEERPEPGSGKDEGRPEPGKEPEPLPRGMSPETPYESRFFIVTVSKEGEIMQSDLSRIVSVDEDTAREYISRIIGGDKNRGFVDDFRYLRQDDERGAKIIFLDCGRKMDSFRSFLWISIICGVVGCIIVFIAFVLTAGRIVAPISESYEKQKRFISDAGHEIKTPLTIINANVDLLELDGEKEELTDIRSQTRRLTELTNDLIMLSKMEESVDSIQKIDFPVSDIVVETANSFRAPALSRKLKFSADIPEGVTMKGSPDSIRRLVSVLLDNAVKYSDPEGSVDISMSEQKRTITITVHNTTDKPVEEKELSHVFDRFYRSDLSRNSATGGHGIGLSMAKAIVNAHGGDISASTQSGNDFTVRAVMQK